MYEYKATVIKVIDGDTVDVDLDLGFDVMLKKERVRIMGIDTPESRTRDKEEKKFGLASKARLKELLGKNTVLVCQKYDAKGKFGRILGDFKIEGGLAGQTLIEEGEKFEVLFLSDWIVLVRVATRAYKAHTEQRRAHCFHPIKIILCLKLRWNRTALGGGGIHPYKAGGHLLFQGGIGQQITCQLPGDEVVHRQIVVVSFDDPIPVRVDAAAIVQM